MRATLIIVALALILPVGGIFAQEVSPTPAVESPEEVKPEEEKIPKKKKKKLTPEELNQQFFEVLQNGDTEQVAGSLDAMKYYQHLGSVLLQAEKYVEAELVYRKDLELFPETGWALHGLYQSLEKQGKVAAAKEIQARFEEAWAHADVELEGSTAL